LELELELDIDIVVTYPDGLLGSAEISCDGLLDLDLLLDLFESSLPLRDFALPFDLERLRDLWLSAFGDGDRE
jgi:hypothetical protein